MNGSGKGVKKQNGQKTDSSFASFNSRCSENHKKVAATHSDGVEW
jgi:hypothetical protein